MWMYFNRTVQLKKAAQAGSGTLLLLLLFHAEHPSELTCIFKVKFLFKKLQWQCNKLNAILIINQLIRVQEIII